MDFREITVTLLDRLLEKPTSDEITMSRELCKTIFDIMLTYTKFYGPEMTYKKLCETLEV